MTRRSIEQRLAEKNTRQADEMCRWLQLDNFTEDARFGRYYLRPPGEARFRSYSWIEIVVLRHGVIVHGDCDTVVFKGFYRNDSGPRGPLYWVGSYNYSYAEEKSDHGISGRSRDWDHQVCREEICLRRREGGIEKDVARALFDAAYDGQNQNEWLAEYWQHAQESEGASAGEVTPYPVFAAQAALRRLIGELESRDMRAASRDWFRRAA